MLILSRREREVIVIRLPDGREVTVRVTGFNSRRRQVRVGIDAPPDVVVFREEVRGQFVPAGGGRGP